MTVNDERYSEQDSALRPFAVESGYDQWAELFGLVTSTILYGEDAMTRGERATIDRMTEQTVTSWSNTIGREVCEVGYQTRDQQMVALPQRLELATVALDADDRADFELFREQSWKTFLYARGDISSAAGKLRDLPLQVAESAFLWGRHGRVLIEGSTEPLPLVVRENGLVTVRPQAVRRQAYAIRSAISETLRNHTPYTPTRRERLMARTCF
jgi:hypothetical protein